MVVCGLFGDVVDGDLAPSSDTAAHAYVYCHMPEIGGVAHPLHVRRPGRPAATRPCVLTAMADEFGAAIPIGPFALIATTRSAAASWRRSGRTGRRRC